MINSMYELLNDIDDNYWFYYTDVMLKLKNLLYLEKDNLAFLAAHLIEYNSLMIFMF